MITLDRYRRRLDRRGAPGSSTLFLVLLAIEGATLLNLQSLLTVHAFVEASFVVWLGALPAADHMQENMTASAGIDAG